jgi:hypothetical protein
MKWLLLTPPSSISGLVQIKRFTTMQTERTRQSEAQKYLAEVGMFLEKVKSNGVQGEAIRTRSAPSYYYEGNPPAPTSTSERDPYGTDPKSGGAKLDAGKPCLWRGAIDYFPGALRAVATVSTFGATKYSWKGWSTVPEGFERYSDALVRHLISESEEGPWDNDSGILHAAHAAWNSLARLEFLLREKSLSATGEK